MQVDLLTPLSDFVVVVRSDEDLKNDKLNPIVFKHVTEELIADQLGHDAMNNCQIREQSEFYTEAEVEIDCDSRGECTLSLPSTHQTPPDPSSPAGRNIQLLERLLAGR